MLSEKIANGGQRNQLGIPNPRVISVRVTLIRWEILIGRDPDATTASSPCPLACMVGVWEQNPDGQNRQKPPPLACCQFRLRPTVAVGLRQHGG